MDLNFYDQVFRSLQSETKNLGYHFSYTTYRNEIDCKNKIIKMKYFIHTLENLYAFCHELGHAREKNPNLELYRSNRLYRIYSEISAWILGFKYVRKYNLPKIKYIKEAIPHLKTYIFYKRKSKYRR